MKRKILGFILLVTVSIVTVVTIQACGTTASGGNVTFKSSGTN